MKTQIFYFSATGNSLNIAKKIAAGLGETELISIPQAIGGQIKASAAKIGLVFPVYAWGLPRIVTDFLAKLEFQKGQYIFAVAASGGNPCGTLLQLRRILRQKGADLDAGFATTEASHAIFSSEQGLIEFVRGLAGKTPESGETRLPEILAVVKNNQKHQPETNTWISGLVGGFMYGFAIQAFKTSDQHFWVDEKCNGCKSCARLCPRGNIRLTDGKPSWNHNCELCFACLQWCPKEAIQYKKDSQNATRSHNSEVTLNDVLLR